MIGSSERAYLDHVIARGLTRAAAPMAALDDVVADQRAWDAPALPRLVEGLRAGFTADEEAWARRSADFQRAVRVAWRVHGVSFWLLARARAEGEAFPFARALDGHLGEEAGDAARLALSSRLVAALEDAMRRVGTIGQDWERLRQRWLKWERQCLSFVTELPDTVGAFAGEVPDPLSQSESFDDVVVSIEEVKRSAVQVSVSCPVTAGADAVRVALLGTTGDALAANVRLLPAGPFMGGQADFGDLADVRTRLGGQCLVLISPGAPPDAE
jgi:hypothetical protein